MSGRAGEKAPHPVATRGGRKQCRTPTACGKSRFQLIGETGHAEKHVREIGIHWTVREESLRRPRGMTEPCIWTTRFAFAPSWWEAPQSAIAHIAERKERAMKLNSAQLERTLNQFEARAIPDDHPLVRKLNDLFGEHTFLLDIHGLNIVEPVETAGESARIVNLANWSHEARSGLEVHEPETTDVVIKLGLKH